MNSSGHLVRKLALSPSLLKNLGNGATSLRRTLALFSHHHSALLTTKVKSVTPIICARLNSTVTNKFEVINVQDEVDFKKRVLQVSCSVPVVVDFHATWCGPCKLLGPRLEAILAEEQGKVVMAKVDIDDNSDLAMEYGVRSVPTVVGLKNGKVHSQFIGLIDDDQIRTFVDKLVIS